DDWISARVLGVVVALACSFTSISGAPSNRQHQLPHLSRQTNPVNYYTQAGAHLEISTQPQGV
ncbi:MAG TPA: hypothetical protein VN155_08315, partial [Devosia sp.]|nr:hypothetical protein [Devosia sp.]